MTTRTEEDGSFAMPRALAGDVSAERPAWEPASTPWDGETETVEVTMEPRMIRGLRVSGDKAADPEVWSELLDLVDGTAVNALIIDTKDETGWVFHETGVELVEEIGALNNGHLYDVEQVIADMDALGLYKITRITTFQDNFLAQAQPDIAIRDEVNGGLWTNDKGIHWLDATDRNAWEYPLDLAVEACELGFDEIQFDYIRFPSDGDVATADTDGDYSEPNRIRHRQGLPQGGVLASQPDGVRRGRRHLRHHAHQRLGRGHRAEARAALADRRCAQPDGLHLHLRPGLGWL